MNYTVAEFRKNIREALNAVERGEEVYITRHNKTFAIIKAPFNYLSDDGKSHDIRPDIPFKHGLGTDMSDATASRIDTRGKQYSHNIEEDEHGVLRPKKNNSEAKASNSTDGFVEAGVDPSGEFPCCKQAKPCKHWQWDGNSSAWVNSLSGRSKEA